MKTTSTLVGLTTLLATVESVAGSASFLCYPGECPYYPPCGYGCMAARLKQLGCPDVACACPLDNFLSDRFIECLYEECNATNKDTAMYVLEYVCEQAGKPSADSQQEDSLAAANSNSTVTVTTFLAESPAFPKPTPYATPGANGGGPAYGYGSTPDSSITEGDPMSGDASTVGQTTVTVVATSVRSPLPAHVTLASGERVVPHLFVLGFVLALAVLLA